MLFIADIPSVAVEIVLFIGVPLSNTQSLLFLLSNALRIYSRTENDVPTGETSSRCWNVIANGRRIIQLE